MKIQRVLAATTLTLLASAIAIAKPAGPAKIGVTPEASVNCPIPTLAQCQSSDYLENDRCGKLQRVNQWTCTSLLRGKMDEEKTKRGESFSPLPKEIDEENAGVGKTVKDTSAHGKNQFTNDLYSYTSISTARDYGITNGPLGIDPYPGYLANKNVVESCEEYAYEKFLDVSEFNRKVAANRNDSLASLRYAYGPGNEPWAIGTRHLANPKLHGRDGREFGVILEGQRRKNAFFGIDAIPTLPNQDKVLDAPNLIQALNAAGAENLLAKTWGTKSTVDNTWAAHRQYGMTLLYIPPDTDPQTTLAIGPVEQDTKQQIKNTFGTVPGPDKHRKRLARELDELFELQERFRSKLHEWARLNERYRGSGWSYLELGGQKNGGVTYPPGHLNPGMALGVNPGKKELGLKAAPSGPKPPAHVGDIAIEDPETVQRKRVLADMVAILEKADDEGCLDDGITACDWSPKLFARAIRNKFADQQDKTFESCMALTKGSIANTKNLHLVYVEDSDPKYTKFNCRIDTGDKITAQQLDELPGKHATCVQQKAAYEAQKKHDEELAAAKAKVLAIPDLVDDPGDKDHPAKFRWPHLSKTRDEQMGGDKFNMGYSYDFGFDMNAQTDICKFTVDSHAHFNTHVTVFGEPRDIIDAEAKFDSEHGEVKLHAKFGSYNLFNPAVDEKFDTGGDQKWEWSVTKTVGSGKKNVRLFYDWMVIVVIPVKIEAGISGEAGIDTGLSLTAQGFNNNGACPSVNLSGLAEPFAEISGYVEAGIDIFVASVGIRGELTIVRASLPFKAGIGAEILAKKDDELILDPKRLSFFTNTSMDLDISTLSGGISVYGKVGWCPFCVKGEKEIVSFEGPHYTQNIFKKQYNVNLNDLAIAMGLVQ